MSHISHTGQLISNYQFDLSTPPAVADINGDQSVEIIAKSSTGMYCFDSNFNPIWMYGISENTGLPAIIDFDGDGRYETIFGSGSKLYCINHAGTDYIPHIAENMDNRSWPMFQCNLQNTGSYLPNRPPHLISIGNQQVDECALLQFRALSIDPDEDHLTYSVTGLLPTGAVFDAATRTFTWTPTYEQAGNYNVTFTVTDGTLSDTETIRITVNNVNRAPVLATIGNKTVNENTALIFTINATDPDIGTTLTYSATGLPTGAVFDPATRTFTWTPTYEQAGNYNVTFTVTDGKLFDTETITITVKNVNRQPVFTAIGNKTVIEGNLLEFTVSATDPDRDTLTYSSVGMPMGAIFNPSTRTFSWTPRLGQAGSYTINFRATDPGGLSANASANITVTPNRPPIFDLVTDKTIVEREPLQFTVNATDPERGALTYIATGLPLTLGATFNPSTRTFSWTPNLGQAGTYTINFKAIDPVGLVGCISVNIRVDINIPPRVDSIRPDAGSAPADTIVSFTTIFYDQNGWQNIRYVCFIVNTSLSSTANCFYGYYDRASNRLFILNDTGTGWIGGYSPGSKYTISNSYAKLICETCTVSGSGNYLSVKWDIVFRPAFRGTKNTYLSVIDNAGASHGPVRAGRWTVN